MKKQKILKHTADSSGPPGAAGSKKEACSQEQSCPWAASMAMHTSAGSQARCHVEGSYDLPFHDLQHQCHSGSAFGVGCTAPSASACLHRCAKRWNECAAYVYDKQAGRCWLKSLSAAHAGSRRKSKHHVLGRCIADSTLRDVAVCVVGQPRAVNFASDSIRRSILEPWDADAFFVSQLSRADRAESIRSAALLGPRVRLAVHVQPDRMVDKSLFESVLHGAGANFSKGSIVLYDQWVMQLMTRYACWRLVRHTEAASDSRYATFARVRSDSMYFAPLPLPASLQPDVVVVPAGDQWGHDGSGVSDRMVIGGRAAFEADATMWQSMRDNPTKFLQAGWIAEGVTRFHLEHRGLRVQQQQMAYCTVSRTGHCRLAEHLAISLALEGPGLLTRFPQASACGRTPVWGWDKCQLDRSRNGACITNFQTEPAKLSDPGFCKLAAAILRIRRPSF